MLRIRCPHCGSRDESEFRYRGDAAVLRPSEEAGEAAFVDYVYQRVNVRGTHLEWWLHVGGCRQMLKVTRDTVSHAITAVALAADGPQP